MPDSVYEKAAKIIADRKAERESQLRSRKNEVFAKIPRLFEIEAQLDRYGIRMLNYIADGKYDETKAVSEIIAENRAYAEERERLLIQSGYPGDYLEIPPFCKICGDTGFDNNKLCSCMKKEMNLYALQSANLSELLSEQTFDKFDISYYSNEYVEAYGCSPRENMSAILDECVSYAENFGESSENLLFCGDCGLGKTFLSSAIANELLSRGTDVLYVSCNALFPILEDIHFGREVGEKSSYIVRKLSECDLLILDDLGSEFVTQFTCAELFRIINTRLLLNKKMIISTNLNRNMIAKTYSDRIASRISGSFSVLEFLGSDIRRIKKLESKIKGADR